MKLDLETYVIFVSFITSFFAVFLSNGIIIGVPAIASEFAMNNVIQNWVPTIFFLVVAVFTVPAGQISGKFGVKKSLLAGVIVYLIASIGACMSFSTESFLVFMPPSIVHSDFTVSTFKVSSYGLKALKSVQETAASRINMYIILFIPKISIYRSDHSKTPG